MSHEKNGQQKRYRIIFSKALQAWILELHKNLTSGEQRAQFRAALDDLVSRLRKNPDDVGEPLYALKGTNLTVHVVTANPITMHFAVNRDVPFVWVTKVVLTARGDGRSRPPNPLTHPPSSSSPSSALCGAFAARKTLPWLAEPRGDIATANSGDGQKGYDTSGRCHSLETHHAIDSVRARPRRGRDL